MIRVDVVPATAEDLGHISWYMRDADRAEAFAMTGGNAASALRSSVRLSHEVWAGRVDDVPVCVFGLGIGSMLDGIARPWLLGTDGVERHSHAFLRRNRAVVDGWRERFPVLENWVDTRNDASKRWLRWLGFVLDAPAPAGPFGYMFHRFELGY